MPDIASPLGRHGLVIPAKAGIQHKIEAGLDTGFRRYDERMADYG
jgi:hypothetical protein